MRMKKKTVKTVLITGTSSGLGRELAVLFERGGDTVIRMSRTNPDDGKNFYECDLTDAASIERACEAVKEDFGKIDILINNAGAGLSGATELLPMDKVENTVKLDYLGTLNLTQRILPAIPCGGKIVNISSACALFPLPYRSVYCSAKAALNMMSFGLRMELGRSGISSVSVCPGDVKTGFTKNRVKSHATNERYGDRPLKAAEKIDSRENKRMRADKTARKIYKIALKKKKAMYIIGGKYKLFRFFERILPTNLFIKIIGKYFG